jgi:hypothetical protein
MPNKASLYTPSKSIRPLKVINTIGSHTINTISDYYILNMENLFSCSKRAW